MVRDASKVKEKAYQHNDIFTYSRIHNNKKKRTQHKRLSTFSLNDDPMYSCMKRCNIPLFIFRPYGKAAKQ